MKTKVTLKRIFHRNHSRLAMHFGFDEKVKAVVQSLNGAAFSNTHRCFYVDDTEENLKTVLKALKEIADVDISAISWKNPAPADGVLPPEAVEPTEPSPPPESPGQLDPDPSSLSVTLRKVSKERPAGEFEPGITAGESAGAVELRINDRDGLLVIRFPGRYEKEWIREIRTYGELKYDFRRNEWLLPWSKMAGDSLNDYFTSKGIKVKVSRYTVNEDLRTERKNTGDGIRAKSLGKNALDGLELMSWFLDDNRYSPRTRESYMAMLDFFFRYFSPKEPGEITEEEISKFLYDFIIRLGYSAAYQNQMVSAIKTYYTISGKGKVNPEYFERPRRSRTLPKVFSKEEVSLILNSAGNLKHKLMLWVIYSCGLRRSEVTNIRLGDLDRERGILHIREGKGRVDRIVPLPEKVWGKLEEYFSGCKPRVYLFEGQHGGRYSSESVYRVFKTALQKAGINKEVGVHTLRHSYATHLHENGLDIRYIQELLGHKSTRTTEIYTHVSRRNLVAVRSPIEDLDLK